MKIVYCPECGEKMRDESIGWRCPKCKGFVSFIDGKFYPHIERPFVPPMTNADRIRAMSDEELAEFLSDFKDCAKDCLVGKGVKDCSGICAARETLEMWLQQPPEEENLMDIKKLVEQLHIAGAGNPGNIFDVAADGLEKLQAELEQAKAERDAAVEDLHKLCPAWKWDGKKEG